MEAALSRGDWRSTTGNNPGAIHRRLPRGEKDERLLLLFFALVVGVIGWGAWKINQPWKPDGYAIESSEHFQAIYPSDRPETARVALKEAEAFLRHMVDTYGESLGGLKLPDERLPVHLFRHKHDFVVHGGGREHLGGFFSALDRKISLIAADRSNAMATTANHRWLVTLRHELVHFLLQQGRGRKGSLVPTWLEEGLAVQLSMAYKSYSNTSFSGRARWALEEPSAPGVPYLVTERRDIDYGYSQLLVSFLLQRDPKQFWGLVRQARQKGLDSGRLEAAFGPLEELTPEWRTFVRKHRGLAQLLSDR